MQRPPTFVPFPRLHSFRCAGLRDPARRIPILSRSFSLIRRPSKWRRRARRAPRAAKAEKAGEVQTTGGSPRRKRGRRRRRKPKSPRKSQRRPAPKEKSPAKPAGPEAKVPVAWVALGSADEASPYRMLATFCNRGAALARIELSSRRYHDLDDRSGYLGHVVMEEDRLTTACRSRSSAREPRRQRPA